MGKWRPENNNALLFHSRKHVQSRSPSRGLRDRPCGGTHRIRWATQLTGGLFGISGGIFFLVYRPCVFSGGFLQRVSSTCSLVNRVMLLHCRKQLFNQALLCSCGVPASLIPRHGSYAVFYSGRVCFNMSPARSWFRPVTGHER